MKNLVNYNQYLINLALKNENANLQCLTGAEENSNRHIVLQRVGGKVKLEV